MCENIFWSDEKKVEHFGLKENIAHHPKNTLPTVKSHKGCFFSLEKKCHPKKMG